MCWKEVTVSDQRLEFVCFAEVEGANISELCRRFGISRKTGYKWLGRVIEARGLNEEVGTAVLDRSRRPLHSPRKTSGVVEGEVLAVRKAHPAWGGRKIASYLKRKERLKTEQIPSASTITEMVRRSGGITPEVSRKHQAWRRFEHPYPNDLWQMDFKGDFPLTHSGGRCYPLTVLDDHSRFSLGIGACADQQRATVQERLEEIFRRYGMPLRMTMDNGSPWGGLWNRDGCSYTRLTAWLMRLGIRVSYSRPYHPQTQGKDERFHRSLKAEVLVRYGAELNDLQRCQFRFNQWRDIYNRERSHEALEMEVPADRYLPSVRRFPETPQETESYYAPGDLIRRVDDKGKISFKSRPILAGRAFTGDTVALRRGQREGQWEIFYCAQHLKTFHMINKEVIIHTTATENGQKCSSE